MNQFGIALAGSYDYRLVALSILIALLASYVALDLAARVTAALGGARRVWLAGGSISMGLGIWSMHFVGMLAFRLPIPVRYGLPTVLLSLLAAILFSAIAFYLVSRGRFGRREAIAGSLAMGAAIAGMHYIGIAAMRVSATSHFSPLLVGLSIVIAVLASLAALSFVFDFQDEPSGATLAKVTNAGLMGLAIAAMHYTGMASTSYVASSQTEAPTYTVSISRLGIIGVATVSLMVIGFTLLMTRMGRQLDVQALQLQSSEQLVHQSRALIDAIPQQIWSASADGFVDLCNQRWRSYMGLELEELRGDGWQSMLHSDDRNRVLKAWQESVSNGTPYELEERHLGADGHYRWFLSRGVPLRDVGGRIVRWYGTNTDIEDLKQAEEAIKQAETRIRLIIDTIPTMAWSVRPDGTVDFVNQRWLDYTGLSLEEEIKEPTRVVHPEDLPRVMEKWLADMAAGKSSEDEMRLRRADGKYRWFLVRTAPLLDEQGNLIKWYGLSIDIEDRKQAEEELRLLSGQLLRSQDEERRRIARDLHDSVAQNLVALAASLDQLRSSIPSATGKSRKLISESKALADQCVREVRTLSYVLHPPMLDEAGLEDAIRHYVDGFTKRSGIQVDLEVSPNVGRMTRDIELALFRVVQESLTNIHRHSGSPEAKIRIDRNPDRLTLAISDGGRGVSGDELRRDGGPRFEFGVGIPSMQERVKLVGGRLDIDSTSSGTTVRVTIPFGRHRHEEVTHSDR